MSWISIDDAVGVLHHALFTDGLAGPGEHRRAGAGHQPQLRRRRWGGCCRGPPCCRPRRRRSGCSSARWPTPPPVQSAPVPRPGCWARATPSGIRRWRRRCGMCWGGEDFAHDRTQGSRSSERRDGLRYHGGHRPRAGLRALRAQLPLRAAPRRRARGGAAGRRPPRRRAARRCSTSICAPSAARR